MVIAIPVVAIVLGIAMLSIAVSTWDGTVVDDYYKRGKEINRVLDRDRYAEAHGLHALLDWSVVDGRLKVSLDASRPVPAAPEIALDFLHPTRSGHDQHVNLALGPDGSYHGVVGKMVRGGWIIQLGTADWRLNARTELRGSTPLTVRFEPVSGG